MQISYMQMSKLQCILHSLPHQGRARELNVLYCLELTVFTHSKWIVFPLLLNPQHLAYTCLHHDYFHDSR